MTETARHSTQDPLAGRQVVLRADAVTRRFDAVVAVDAVTLDLPENAFFALLGPSGCGKTTLLRMIAGFDQPDSGRILLDGQDITAIRPNRRPINLMFQSYALFPHMTVRGNVSYGLEMERVAKPERARRVDEVLAATHLDAYADRKPDQLSGGQRQRVALARALVKRPRVLLLDEPLGALDRKLRETMQLELKRLQHEVGITFVVVTHDQSEALVMADRIALMNHGRVVQLGTPHELYEHPNSRFAADFIGITNFVDGTATGNGIDVAGAGALPGTPINAKPGEPATLAVRPERVRVAAADAAIDGVDVLLDGRVADVAYHGEDVSVHVAVPGLPQPVLAKVGAAANDAMPFAEGLAVRIGWAATSARVLAADPTDIPADSSTGDALDQT